MKNTLRILAVLTIALAGLPGSAQDQRRQTTSGDHFLELSGNLIGLLRSAQGGDAFAEVVNEAVGSETTFVHKHIGQPKYEDFKLTFGFALKPELYNWIGESLKGNHMRKDGSVHALDFQRNAVTQRQFFNALISEFTIPECDGSVRDPGYLALKFSPELTRDLPASGNVGNQITHAYQTKRWLKSNFRLHIDGIDCKRVNKVDSFTIKQPILDNVVGEGRDYLKEPGKLEFPNLKVTFPATAAGDWNAWFKDFVINGNAGQENEKNGSLEFLAPDLKTVLATVKFFNLGIFKIAPQADSAKSCDCDLCQTVVDGANSADRLRHLTAQMYCERMEFEFPQPAPAGD